MDYKDLRKDYNKGILDFAQTDASPLNQLKNWLEEAIQSGIDDANAMSLSTVSQDGRPSSRFVLLKEIQDRGIIFFTNYQSRKGQEMDSNPFIALNFYWKELERQVRIEGKVVKTTHEESKQYFISRPLSSRISAIVSPQSQTIPNKKILEDKVQYYEEHTEEVECPEHWGGYLVIPQRFEFWHGRSSRLHDRLVYILEDEKEWVKSILAP
ncbi:MAG: pyridoxamine 5'-phosphate oxidase [Saprospiraceae bacterium]